MRETESTDNVNYRHAIQTVACLDIISNIELIGFCVLYFG